MTRSSVVWLCIFLLAAIGLAWLAPLEKTLGANARLVYFHGAWVWAALAGLLIAAGMGLAGVVARRWVWHAWSRAWARSGLSFWVLFLPMSLAVMQANWNGVFLDEPRFRTPLNLAIVGVLLQAGLALMPASAWTSLANLAYGAALWYSMNQAEAVLHPEAPILQSEARGIQAYFFSLLILLLLASWQLARLWRRGEKPSRGKA